MQKLFTLKCKVCSKEFPCMFQREFYKEDAKYCSKECKEKQECNGLKAYWIIKEKSEQN